MPKLSAMNSRGEYLNNFNSVRMRLTGSGNLLMTMFTLDDINSVVLTPLVMSTATDREPTRLTNITSQRAALKISVDEIDEYFEINRLIIYTKAIFDEYPM